MNREDVIRLAREAGLLMIGTADGGEAVYTWPHGITDELKRFAALVAAVEREACAVACQQIADKYHMKRYATDWQAQECVEAIRARSAPCNP